MQSMSAQDAMFLDVENDVTPMHIGGVSVFDVPPPRWEDTRVRDRMRPLSAVPVVEAERDVAEAIGELTEHDLHRALVVVDGRPAGLLSVTDVARLLDVLAAAKTGGG